MRRFACRVGYAAVVGSVTLGVWTWAFKPVPPPEPEVAVSSTQEEALSSPTLPGGSSHGAPAELAAAMPAAAEGRPAPAPAWAVGYGKEFWRRPSGNREVTPGMALPAHVDLGDVMERVSHALERDASTAAPVIQARSYTARFQEDGLRFAPHHPETTAPDAGIEAVFRTRAVRRGPDRLVDPASGGTTSYVLGNTVQRALNTGAGVIEHYEARSGGVEVCWVLPQPPPGAGSLSIEAELLGLRYAGQCARGHHFADASGTPRVRVGHATLVDAAGRRTDLEVSAQADALVVTVPEEALIGAEFPVAIDPLISPEFGMDEPVLSFSLELAQEPAIASNGSEYLAVWVDYRVPGLSSIFGTRISRDGVVLDPRGRQITAYGGGVLYPAVASNGEDYLVAWRGGFTGGVVLGTRVTREGVPLDTNAFLQIGHSSAHPRPAIASDGTNYLVVWEHPLNSADGGEDILGARVGNDGRVLDSPSLVLGQAPGRQRGPAVACNGSLFLVAWNDDMQVAHSGQIVAARVSGSGLVLDPGGILVGGRAPGTFPTAAVASDGRDFLVVGDGVATRVSATGARLGSVSLGAGGIPAVASNGRDYLVVLLQPASIRSVLVSGTGVVIASNPLAVAGSDYHPWTRPAVAGVGGDFVAAWDDRYLSNGRILGALVTGAGEVAARDIPLSTDFNAQLNPAVAGNGTDYLVVWSDYRPGTFMDIYGVRLDGDGVVLDPAGLAIRRGAGLEQSPAVGSNGSDYWVAWQEYRGGSSDRWVLKGSRVSGGGAVLDPEGVLISMTEGNAVEPAVAGNGGDYLVAWVDWNRTGNRSWDIFAARVTGEASVLDPNGFVLVSTPGDQYGPAVASDGSDYLVAWSDFSPGNVAATRVTSQGVVSTPDGTLLRRIPSETYYPFPSVGFNGREYLVVWHENEPGLDTDIRGARVAVDGTPLDATPLTICSAPGRQAFPTVAGGGGNWLVAWSDQRHALGEIFGASVTAAGTVVEPGGFFLAQTGPPHDSVVSLANSGPGFLAAYGVRQDGYLYRVRGRMITPTPDEDGDGVLNEADDCPNTPPGAVVDVRGCSLDQLCPCEGPWRSHGDYIQCVIAHAWEFFRAGLISAEERRAIVGQAARSDCGRQPPAAEPVRLHVCPQTPHECREGLRVVVSGDAGGPCVVEGSTDLIHWTALTAGETVAIGEEIRLPAPGELPARFFRVRRIE